MPEDIAEPVIVAFKVSNDCGIAKFREAAIAAFYTLNSLMGCFGANSWLPLISTSRRIANAPVLSAISMSVNIFAPGKETAKELEFIACRARAGDDALDLCSFIEQSASFFPLF